MSEENNVVLMANAAADQSLWTPRQMLEHLLETGVIDEFEKATIVLRNDEDGRLASSRAGWDSLFEEAGVLQYVVHSLMHHDD